MPKEPLDGHSKFISINLEVNNDERAWRKERAKPKYRLQWKPEVKTLCSTKKKQNN